MSLIPDTLKNSGNQRAEGDSHSLEKLNYNNSLAVCD